MSMFMYVGITISVSQSVGAYMSSSMYMLMFIHDGAIRHPDAPHASALTVASSTRLACLAGSRPAWRVPMTRRPAMKSPAAGSMWPNRTPAGAGAVARVATVMRGRRGRRAASDEPA